MVDSNEREVLVYLHVVYIVMREEVQRRLYPTSVHGCFDLG